MQSIEQKFQPTVSQASLKDIPEMAQLEAHWNYRHLPPNALSETGALFVPLGSEGLKRVLSDEGSRILIVRQSENLQGMLVACGKSLALEMWPYLSSNYAPRNTIWQEPFIYVKTVAIDPGNTGKGLGTLLVLKLREVAIETNQKGILAGIAVDPPNRRSLALFRNSLGSQEIGRHYDEEKRIMWGLFKCTLTNI